jgi:superfamily II RNA helicase
MTLDELEQLIAQQPVAVLHRLSRGRVHRHFRAGKRRLIELILQHSSQNLAGLESDLQALIAERQSRPQPPQPPARPAGRAAAPQPFVPDPWQEEALAALDETDVVVSVPTGSGKTYVAVEAAKRAIAHNQTVIYTSPLKALSNTKYTEFSRIFGSDKVGILTGDRQENGQAPLLIMTTEILRNLLYDAASGEIDIRLDTLGLVILDESQYIADPERGVVWEETIIFCPSQAKLLLLSASIGNPQDIADWLTSIRPTTCRLVRHSKRTVPLRAGYLHPNGKLVPLFKTAAIPSGHAGHLHPEAKRLFFEYEEETLPSGRSRR